MVSAETSVHFEPAKAPKTRTKKGGRARPAALGETKVGWLAGAPGFEPGDGGIKIRPTPALVFGDYSGIRRESATAVPGFVQPIPVP